MNWKEYHPNDPASLRPFIEYLIQETFTKPMKQEFIDGKKPVETYEEAHARVMKELKEHVESFPNVHLKENKEVKK